MPTAIIVGTNPPRGAGRRPRHARGVQIGSRVDRVYYEHVTHGPRVHRFETPVRIEGLADGSVRIYSPRGARLWEDR